MLNLILDKFLPAVIIYLIWTIFIIVFVRRIKHPEKRADFYTYWHRYRETYEWLYGFILSGFLIITPACMGIKPLWISIVLSIILVLFYIGASVAWFKYLAKVKRWIERS